MGGVGENDGGLRMRGVCEWYRDGRKEGRNEGDEGCLLFYSFDMNSIAPARRCIYSFEWVTRSESSEVSLTDSRALWYFSATSLIERTCGVLQKPRLCCRNLLGTHGCSRR